MTKRTAILLAIAIIVPGGIVVPLLAELVNFWNRLKYGRHT